LIAEFDLTGVAWGKWELRVENPDGTISHTEEAKDDDFDIKPGKVIPTLNFQYPQQARIGRTTTHIIEIANRRNVDARFVFLEHGTRLTLSYIHFDEHRYNKISPL
jgi:hypothetical protein